jgi:hypothetical protein
MELNDEWFGSALYYLVQVKRMTKRTLYGICKFLEGLDISTKMSIITYKH